MTAAMDLTRLFALTVIEEECAATMRQARRDLAAARKAKAMHIEMMRAGGR